MKKFLGILLVLLSLNSYSQQWDNYSGEWGVSSYDTLTNYTSLLWDVLPSPSLYYNTELEIEFGFPFPYFDQVYNTLNISGMGYVFFGFNWYEIYNYAGFFERHKSMPYHSDWRMQRDTVGMDILKFEWKDIGLLYDIDGPSPTDHRLNFQLWLYENGIIEYHYGDINLKNTPWYNINTGFTNPEGMIVGPWVMIVRRMIEEEHYFHCNNDSISFFSGGAMSGDIYHCIPNYGTWFRFIPNEVVKTKDVLANNNRAFYVTPNPVKDKFVISMPHKINLGTMNPLFEIYSQTGVKVYSGNIDLNEYTDISFLTPGYYTCSLYDTQGKKYNTKLIKQ